jgi:DMSO reductase anchor subunit
MMDHAGHRPLVVFTSLAGAGAGLVAASAYFDLVHGLRYPAAAAGGTVLLAAGLGVSLGHLGQKRRAGLAVRGAGRSALSNEALLAGLALAAAAIAAGLGLGGAPSPIATALAGLVNAAFLMSIGLVYHVPGQRTWQGFSAATPLTGGLAFGAIGVQSLAAPGSAFTATLLFIALDALLFSQRWRDIVGIPFSEDVLANPWQVRRTQLLAGRFFLLDVIPFFVLAVSPRPVTILVAAAGLVVDRFSFYALALQHTTEHEVAAVEAQLAALDHPAQD